MEFDEIDFYDYKIRMCVDKGIRIYLVFDLLRQYNEKHGTNKRFKNYLNNKQAQEVIKELANTGVLNSGFQANGNQNDQNIDGRDSTLQAIGIQDDQTTESGIPPYSQMRVKTSSLTFLM